MDGVDQDELTESQADEPAAPRRFGRPAAVAVVVVLLAGLGIGLGLSLGSSTPATPQGPEGVAVAAVPDLAPASTTSSGRPVDGITCRKTMDQKETYHVHVLLQVYVRGQLLRIPAGAGIADPFPEHLADGLFVDNSASGCLYWLHVHADDDVIHVEAPAKGTFTLGQFFDIWQQPLGPDQVGPARGTVVAFENGKRFIGNPRDIPLTDKAVVQLDVGTPVVAFHKMHFKVTGLCASNVQSCAIGG